MTKEISVCQECKGTKFRWLYMTGDALSSNEEFDEDSQPEGGTENLIICTECGAEAPYNVNLAQVIED